jgi:hypothetical protein
MIAAGLRKTARRVLPVALFALLAACAQLPPVGASSVPRIPLGQARIWVYRDLETSAIPEVPYVRFNGAIAGAANQGGAFYRDVAPGSYHVTVDSIGTDFNQASDVTLAAGQEAYIHILQLDNWFESAHYLAGVQRATFYAWLMSPEVGRAGVWRSSFYGGGELTAALH